MRLLSFWQESEYLQNSGQAFLVRQGSLVFIEHFTIANDRSTYVTDKRTSHAVKGSRSHDKLVDGFSFEFCFSLDAGDKGYSLSAAGRYRL